MIVALLDIILLSASFLGILCGLYLLFRAYGRFWVVILSALSLCLIALLVPDYLANLRFLGCEWQFIIDHSTHYGYYRLLSYGLYLPLLLIDLASVIYASLLVLWGRRVVLSRG